MSNYLTLLKIKNILEAHQGRSNPVFSAAIAEELNLNDKASTPLTRSLIKEAIIRFDLPVAAHGGGYYMITSREELKEYTANLRGRIRGIQGRIDAVSGAFERSQVIKKDHQQMELC